MGNGFGTMFVGVAGLKSSQNALNITANNITNVDSTGYVRQQVLFTDRNYVTFNTTAAISKQQTGLGVQIGDVIHTRDIFLDRSYRSETSRQAFYGTTYEAIEEIETYFQEMEGQAFQDALGDFWGSFQELNKAPDDSVFQNLVIQKAQLFLSRSNAIYEGLQNYQYTLNAQASGSVDQINELGKVIHELNSQIMKVEAGGVETAMTLRDARDQALDELSKLVDISYTETSNGVVKVDVEGVEFVGEVSVNEMGVKIDGTNGFVTPYWPHLSDKDANAYTYVFDFRRDISTENKNDMGQLKALILARGDHMANYRDIVGMDQDVYNDSTGMSVMLRAEAQIDQLMHGIVTAINDILAPNTEASNYLPNLANGGTVIMRGADGKDYTVAGDTKILDMDNCPVGSDKKLPPQEMFTRIGVDRYTEVEYTDPAGVTKKYYIYNEEDPTDTAKQYTLQSLRVNEELIRDESILPHLLQNGDVSYDLARDLVSVWEDERLTLSPNDTRKCSFKKYYEAMMGEVATYGSVFGATAASLSTTVGAIDNQRQQVLGVSADEELTYMIKYQNAYNASSRFINVIDEMLEQLITQLG